MSRLKPLKLRRLPPKAKRPSEDTDGKPKDDKADDAIEGEVVDDKKK